MRNWKPAAAEKQEQEEEQGSEGYRAAKKYTTTITKNAKITCIAMLTGPQL